MEETKPDHNPEDTNPSDIEPPLNIPSTAEAFVPVDSNIKSEQTATHHPQLTTKDDMEVHHHAHDPAAPHQKKNWKRY